MSMQEILKVFLSKKRTNFQKTSSLRLANEEKLILLNIFLNVCSVSGLEKVFFEQDGTSLELFLT